MAQADRTPHPVGLGAASGLGLYLAFDPVGAWWLAWVALVPLLMLVRSRRPARSVYLGAWVGGLVFWLLAVEWVRSSDEGAWPGWLAMALVLSLWWPATLAAIRAMVRGSGLPLMLAAPAAWIAIEYVRGLYPLNGFHWFCLAHSQVGLSPLIQVVDLAGAWGLSGLVVLVNAWIIDLIERPLLRRTTKGSRPDGPQLVRAAIVVAALAGALGYGAARLATSEFRPGPTVALLQSDFPQVFGDPHDPRTILDTFNRLAHLAMDGPERPDLIVWPETMYPASRLEIDPELTAEEAEAKGRSIYSDFRIEDADLVTGTLREWADRFGVPMVFGINTDYLGDSGIARYNSAVLVEPDGGAIASYHKLHLVPFGEYIPLLQTMPWLLAFTPFDAEHMPGLDPGPGPVGLRLGRWRLAAAICLEDSVPHVARALATEAGDRPPDVLLNLSNDGWFRGTAAHELHLANSVLRAVELRVPVARAVNTGISAVIDGDGTVREALPEATSGVLVSRVPLDPRTSLYAAWGDWMPIGCLGLLAAAVPAAAVRARLRRRREASSEAA